jgi:hypothetical protein
MSSGNTTSAAKARKLGNQIKALELRRMGRGYVDIASTIGISKSQAHRLVKQGLADARAQVEANANELKVEEISRLDAMLGGLWAGARSGNVAAVDRVLKIMERRAKLLGLDAPVRTAIQGGGDDAPPVSTVSETKVTFYMPDNGRG